MSQTPRIPTDEPRPTDIDAARSPCRGAVADIPKVTVTVGPPVVNGRAVSNPTGEAVYSKGLPVYADTVAKDGALVITVGQSVEGRQKRRTVLIDGKK